MELNELRMLLSSLNEITCKGEENHDLLLGCILLVKAAIEKQMKPANEMEQDDK